MSETANPLGSVEPLNKQRAFNRSFYWNDGSWGVYDSPIYSYQRVFNDVLGGVKIEDLVAPKANPTVIDIMAPTGTLRDTFYHIPGPRKLGIAVALEDRRTEQEKARDDQQGIKLVTGDITWSKTWKELNGVLDGCKADLIMERAEGGLVQLPRHPIFYGVTLQRMWHMLSDQGILLLQLPGGHDLLRAGVDVGRWVSALAESGIEARYSYEALYIKRSPSSPGHLPFKPEIYKLFPGAPIAHVSKPLPDFVYLSQGRPSIPNSFTGSKEYQLLPLEKKVDEKGLIQSRIIKINQNYNSLKD